MKEGSIENHEKVTLYSKAEELRKEYPDTEDFVCAVQRFIRALPERYNPKSIIESRFTPADEAFEKGMMSCGAITNMSAAMIRHVGLEVKLIHGEFDESVDHAWISVFDPESGEWASYDLTRNIPTEMPTHVEKARVDDWEEIRDKILSDHETLRERNLARRNLLK
jgi:transglutaminase-like putative cysteine protease